MDRTRGELKRRTDRFKAVIRDAGVKITPQRIAIYRETARTSDHPHLEKIYRNVRRKMPGVSLDTVYRTLDLFRELGLVSRLKPFPGPVRFDANTSPHHHFVCGRCGLIRDFNDPGLNGLKIPMSARALGSVESVHVEVLGLCPTCATGKGKKNGATGTRSRRINKILRRD